MTSLRPTTPPACPQVNSGQFRSILGLGIRARARTQFRLGGPYLSHAKEMPLQSGIMQVAHQLHAVCRQAHALKGMLSQAIRLGHSAPPWNTDARASHGVAGPSVAYATQKRRIFTGDTRTPRGGGCVRPLPIVVVIVLLLGDGGYSARPYAPEHWS